ncbi:FHA domain-containing protein [Mesorhizobium sp. M0915]|uniref:FHA domain-containing protein n=1 Tax=Mesorhizobium sp. M0915 TaxID=2957027 RepID=UPI003337DDBF
MDEKTQALGSTSRGPAESNVRPSEDGKTVYVANIQTGAEERHSLEGGGESADDASPPPIRPSAQRLAWPARDLNRERGDENAGALRQTAPGSVPSAQDTEATILFGKPVAARPAAELPSQSERASQALIEEDLAGDVDAVVGWVVIVQGPGKGRSIEIGVGANSIGREQSQKLRLNFGDTQIHREKHAVLIYEPNSRRFFLQGGDVRNLTYLNGQLVLTPSELLGGETILIGQTHLRFVPLCGPDFGWP